jgi:hypothetical protein
VPSAQGQTDGANSQASSESSNESDSVGIAAAVAVNVLVLANTAEILAGTTIDTDGAVTVDATADFNAITEARGDAFDISGGTGVGAAVGFTWADVDNIARVGPAPM